MKNSNIIKVSAVIAMVAASAGIATAQSNTDSTTQSTTTTTSTTTTEKQPPQIVAKSSQLIGTKVENQQGQCLGRISDVVVDFNTQKVSYAVLSTKHGFLSKTRYIPVPLAAFQANAGSDVLILNATRANLAQARGYENGQWPTSITPAWGAEPAPTVELPPVEVFGPEYIPAPAPVARTYYGDPTRGPMPVPRTASQAIDEMADGVAAGWPVR